MTGYIWIDNKDGDAFVNHQVFWTREAAEESLEAWMSQYAGVTKHSDGNYYYKGTGEMLQAYVQEINIPV